MESKDLLSWTHFSQGGWGISAISPIEDLVISGARGKPKLLPLKWVVLLRSWLTTRFRSVSLNSSCVFWAGSDLKHTIRLKHLFDWFANLSLKIHKLMHISSAYLLSETSTDSDSLSHSVMVLFSQNNLTLAVELNSLNVLVKFMTSGSCLCSTSSSIKII